jgi:hypothetical protein
MGASRFAAVWLGISLCEFGTALGEQLAQDRSVAMVFIDAVASQRKIRCVGKRSEEIENSCGVRLIHFRSKLTREDGPRFLVVRCLAFFHEGETGREIGEPYIVEISLGKFGFGDASWGPANRA